VIRADHSRLEFSFSQVAKLIENIGYVGKIDDFTIKPLTQNSFLLIGFSGTLGTASKASCIHRDAISIQLQHGKAVDARAIASCKGELLHSEDDDVLSNSDPDLSGSDDDGSSTEDEQGRSSTRKHSVWLPLDEQRLLAYKKEGKSWSWIFRKFPGRTPGAVRTRRHMVRARELVDGFEALFPDDDKHTSADLNSLGAIMLEMMKETRESLDSTAVDWSAEAVDFVEATSSASPDEPSDVRLSTP